jgi:hypothetical protein
MAQAHLGDVQGSCRWRLGQILLELDRHHCLKHEIQWYSDLPTQAAAQLHESSWVEHKLRLHCAHVDVRAKEEVDTTQEPPISGYPRWACCLTFVETFRLRMPGASVADDLGGGHQGFHACCILMIFGFSRCLQRGTIIVDGF